MKLRFSLADRISLTIIFVGAIGIMLVYYMSDSYKEFAYRHHTQAIQQLARLEMNDLIEALKTDSLNLAQSIEHEKQFKSDFQDNHLYKLTQHLNNQFDQYFVTAGILKLVKLYVLDRNLVFLSTSNDTLNNKTEDSKLICPQLVQSAAKRQGAEKLQTLSRICNDKNLPVLAVMVPIGGLNPKGYIQVTTDLAFNLRVIEKSLAMPVELRSLDNEILYRSEQWHSKQLDSNYITVELPVFDEDGQSVMNISLKTDMTTFNREIQQHRNWVMTLALIITTLTVFIVLIILRRSTIEPLAKIHHVLERIHSHPVKTNNNSRVLFEQLLENIILLRAKSKTKFAVMLLDLTRFKLVNDEYGKDIGDLLLTEVELRLNAILRDSDLISWVGTDTPGHKLMPTDTQTQYRATIARLGGDEFGLLLPSAQSEKQALAVAERIVETLNNPFLIQAHHIDIKCKIGISIYPDHGADEKLLIRNADKAMQLAELQNRPILVFDATVLDNGKNVNPGLSL